MKAKDLKQGRWYSVKELWVGRRMKLVNATADLAKHENLRSDSQRKRGGCFYTPGRVLMQDESGTIKSILPRQILRLWTEQEKRNAEKEDNDKAAAKEHDRIYDAGQKKLRGLVSKLRALNMKKGTHYNYEADDVRTPDDVDYAITLTETGVQFLHNLVMIR